mmetsp:Transcript_20959/g.58319  ORF Transcript_20959/g.58319 Transcript_20959/m.58319 type:complete len:100 (+) Transcript_20959:394-693(+)
MLFDGWIVLVDKWEVLVLESAQPQLFWAERAEDGHNRVLSSWILTPQGGFVGASQAMALTHPANFTPTSAIHSSSRKHVGAATCSYIGFRSPSSHIQQL